MLTTRAPGPGPAAGGPVQRWGFRSMGMDVLVTGPLPTGDRDRRAFAAAGTSIERMFHDLDARFSRFRAESELSRVNSRAGRWQMVSSPFAELLRYSLDAAKATEGLFDPTVLPALLAAGYDRDFDELIAAGPRRSVPPGPPKPWTEVELDGRMLFLSEGAALDFGGIAKGWAVDRATERASALPWVLVDAGGDLAVGGHPPAPLPIGIADPADADVEIARIGLEGGALATSSVVGRSWGPGMHHVIDPRTWRPARTRALQATAWAVTCAEAEVLAKWSLLRGPRALREAPAVLVMADGRTLTSLHGTVGEAAAC
jgi:thiamine biosynthesis lipoprotein